MRRIIIEDLICSHPVPKFPYYHAKIMVRNNTNSKYYINKLIVNKKGSRDFVIFSEENFIFEPVILPKAVSWIYARADWENKQDINVEINLIGENKKEDLLIKHSVTAPDYGGYWNKEWKYYFSVIATERFGIERKNEPIHISTTLYADRISNPEKEIRVIEVDSLTGKQALIPSQVYGISERYNEISNESVQPSVTFDIAFFANVNKNNGRVYLVFYGNQNAEAPVYKSRMQVDGEMLGLSIENDYYRVNLHKKSGSIDQVITKMGINKVLEHRIETNGCIHWNPGFYSPPAAWTHTSDWEDPAFFNESGPVFLLTQRYDPLPLYPETYVSQTYIFYSQIPVIRVNSVIDINKGRHIQALRNGEIVFNLDTITNFALRDKAGDIKNFVLTDLPRFEEIALTFEADTPWTAFYNPTYKFGFAEVTLNIAAIRRLGGLPRLEHHYQYVNWGPWYYVTRNLIFPFGSQNPQRMSFVPESSTYFEDMLFVPFIINDGLAKEEQFNMVEESYKVFKNPLHIQVEHDTDIRVPAQFVLGPRLTGEVQETEEKPWPITLSSEYTRFRQSPALLNEIHFKEKDGKCYYR